MSRRLPTWLIFLIAFAAIQAAWEGVRPTMLGRQWVEGLLVPASAQLLSWVQPQATVQVRGRKLQSPRGGITVQRGCEGMEFMAMGWAALLTLALSGRRPARPVAASPDVHRAALALAIPHLRRLGLAWLVVTAGVLALATLRLASLMWCRMVWPDALGLWHGMLTPVLMVLGTAALCAPWLRPVTRPAAA